MPKKTEQRDDLVQVPITFDRDLLERIDKERGLVPRASYVREMMRKALEAGITAQ